MTKTTSHEFVSGSRRQSKNALEIAAGQSEAGREEGRNVLNLAGEKHGSFCARARKKQGAGLLSAAKMQIFCMAHVGESSRRRMGVRSRASWEPGLSG